MAGKDNRCLGLVASLLVIAILAGGCHHEATPGTKQARLIAAENMQLQKSLAGREAELDKLRAQHARDLKQKEDQLATCRKRIATLQSDLQKGIAERVNSVTAAVMDENARLRREVETLKARLPRNP